MTISRTITGRLVMKKDDLFTRLALEHGVTRQDAKGWHAGTLFHCDLASIEERIVSLFQPDIAAEEPPEP